MESGTGQSCRETYASERESGRQTEGLGSFFTKATGKNGEKGARGRLTGPRSGVRKSLAYGVVPD